MSLYLLLAVLLFYMDQNLLDYFDKVTQHDSSTSNTDLHPSNNLLRYFDNITSDNHTLEQKTTSDVSQTLKPVRLKPFRIKFKDQQQNLMSLNTITDCLQSFKQRCFKATCCNLQCHEKLCVQTIAFCRSQYVLLPTFRERNAFLDNIIRMKADNKKKRSYFVQRSDGINFRVCSAAWRLAYGVSEGTFKKMCYVQQSWRVKDEKEKKGWIK
jgi:hypothetical protein